MTDKQMFSWIKDLLTEETLEKFRTDDQRWRARQMIWTKNHYESAEKLLVALSSKHTKEELTQIKEKAKNPAFIQLVDKCLEYYHG